MSEVHICDVCKNPMVLGECYKCLGFGKVSLKFGLFPRTCPRCGGTGKIYSCSNYRKHGTSHNS